MFADEVQEQAFCVKGGLLWFHHILIAAVEVTKQFQVRISLHLTKSGMLICNLYSCGYTHAIQT